MLSISNIIEINRELLGSDFGIKKDTEQLVGSALSAFSYERGIKLQISSIVKGIIKNHPFSEGNKRTGAVILIILAEKEGLVLQNDTLFKVIMDIARSSFTTEEVSKLIFGENSK